MTVYHMTGVNYKDTYYVDATAGDDDNNGLSVAQAWQTIAKVNASTFNPGDRILFKRGETWRGEGLIVPSSGASGNPITFGAYGSGANPLIDPTTEFNDWTLDSGAIWKRSDTNYLTQIFEDGVRLTYEPDLVSMVQGSWCKVAGTPGTAYVWCSDDGNPNTGHVIEYVADAQMRTICMNGKSHLVFDGIDVTKSGIAAYNTDVAYNADLNGTVVADITIKNCTVSWSGIRGMLIGVSGDGTDCYPIDVTISNCVGHDDLDLSFWIGRGTRLIVEDCETYNSGVDVNPGAKNYPVTGTFTHYPTGILVSGNSLDCIVRRNYVHDVRTFGILDELSLGLKGTNTIIERNLIDTTAYSTPAIQVSGINTIVRNNIILSGAGAGIMLNNAPTAPEFYHNTIISPSGAATSVDTASQPGIIFKNNIVVRAGATNRYISLAAAAQTGAVINNNLYYGASTERWFWGPTEYTTFATWKSNSGQDANGLNEDPDFVVEYTNLHLQSTSPCRNAGADLDIATDYDGVARDDTPDIGALEYVADKYYFVDATTGSDSDDGLSWANAWQTIAKVNASTFQPGDQILFKRGETWAEMLTPPSSGSDGLPIVFADYGSGAKPVIDGSALNHSLSIPSAAVHHLSFYNIKFAGATGANRETCRVFTHDFLMDGCEVTGSAAYLGFGAWSETGADIYNLTLTDCLFYGNYKSGLYIGSDDGTAGPHDCLVEDCTAYDNGNNNSADHGFYVCYGTRVNRCTAYNNCAAGFKTNHGVATPPFTYNPIIENCYSYSDANSPPGTAHQWFGIYVGADSSIIRNNHVGPEMKNSNIYLDPGADNCDVFFNTFCNSKSAPSIQVDGGNTGCDIRNNIFCNDTTISGANTLWDENAGALSTFVQNNVIDYNVYYYDGNVATKVFGYADYNWAEWKALTGSPDAHSTMLTALPGFVARYTDLHAAAAGNLLNTGIAIAGLDVDKDGGNRSDTTPTAGCYEDAS